MVEFLRSGVAGKQIEKLGEILSEGLPAGEQTEVAVNPSRAHVVIARGKMAIASNTVGFLTHDQANLAVSFISDHAVDHVSADFFQRPRPGNVGLLVEA